MKEEATIIEHFEAVKKKKFQLLQHDLPDFITERFSNFFKQLHEGI